MSSYLFTLMSFILLIGCNYREEKTVKKVFSDKPTFVSVSEQILKPNCYSCHSGVNAAMGIDLSNYTELIKSEVGVIAPGEPLNSTLFLNIQSGRMPPGGPRLNDSQIKLIFNWIAEGAIEN